MVNCLILGARKLLLLSEVLVGGGWGDYYLFFTIAMWLNEYQIACLAGVSGKGFLAPGNGKGN